MFIILLTYTKPVDKVDQWLADHKAWLKRGFEAGVFVFSGGQRPRVGGDRSAIEARVERDPFLLHGVALAQIIQIVPSAVDERVSLLRSS